LQVPGNVEVETGKNSNDLQGRSGVVGSRLIQTKNVMSPTSAMQEVLAQHLLHERTLGWGTMFGEIALVSDMPYFNTTIAKG
jgi:CRP-like cAMP-binding protein